MPFLHSISVTSDNKKVLLRERKRHTARRVLSTPSVVLPGYPPSWPGGVPYQGGPYLGTPWQGTPVAGPGLGGPDQGTPPPQQGTPQPDLAGGVPDQGTSPGRVPPTPLAGYPPGPYLGNPPGKVPPPSRVPPWVGYPPVGYPPSWTWQGTPPGWTWQGTPRCLPHGILGNVAKHYGIWVPPPPCWQTDGWKDRCVSKHYLPVVLRTRAVKILSSCTNVGVKRLKEICLYYCWFV